MDHFCSCTHLKRIPCSSLIDPKIGGGSNPNLIASFPCLPLQDVNGYLRARAWFSLSNSFRPKTQTRSFSGKVVCRGQAGKDSRQADSSPDLDISVFRFTLGIPGFDESELPRVLGLLLGGLLLLNHVLSSATITAEQGRSEVVGLLLAVVAISLPFLGRRLKGAKLKRLSKIQSTRKQIFVLGASLNQYQKEELAWASYALLRNANIIAVMFWFSGVIVCARGFWNIETKPASVNELDWLHSTVKQTPLFSLNGQLYLPTGADEQGWSMILPGACSLLAQAFTVSSSNTEKDLLLSSHGVLVVSDFQGINEKDRTWIGLIGKKVVDMLMS